MQNISNIGNIKMEKVEPGQARVDFVQGIYAEEDEGRDALIKKMQDEGLCEVPFQIAKNNRLPIERVYFTGDMLSKYEPCTDALQNILDADGEDDDAWAAFENFFSKFMDFSWGSKWDGKKYDIVFYGVSGYTGYLSMQYIKRVSMRQNPGCYTFAFAGRTVSKTVDMRDRNFPPGQPYCDTPIIRCSYDDPISVIDMCKSARTIINVAGPYMLTPGEILVDACTWTGTHYFDINGELPWMIRLCELHEKAKDSGAIIMPCAAMAGGIAQMLTTFLLEKIRGEFGEQEMLDECIHYAIGGGTGGGTSGGTLGSRLAMNQAGDAVRMRMADPYTLGGFIPKRDDNGVKDFMIKAGSGATNIKVRPQDQDAALAKLTEDKYNRGCYKAPFTYAFFDTRIARRTNMLLADELGRPWGRDMCWTAHMLFTQEMLVASQQGGGGMMTQAATGGVAGEKEALMAAGKYYKQGEGPALEDLGDAWTGHLHYIRTMSGQEARCGWAGCDGYFETARVMVECAQSILWDWDQLQCKKGVITSGSCCSEQCIKRMVETGVHWNGDGWLAPHQFGPPAGCM